jgi:hypothetical protein
MQALPRLRRRDADTTSYVADYLTRSVRRASGFVLVGQPEAIQKRAAWRRSVAISSKPTFGPLGSRRVGAFTPILGKPPGNAIPAICRHQVLPLGD